MSLKEIVVKKYDTFWSTVKEMDAEATRKNIPLVFIVKSSPQPDGKCWCRDCGILDKMLKEKLYSMKLSGILVTGEAGALEEWLENDNRFKKDQILSLEQIPTGYRWKDGRVMKRLECPDLFNPEKFKTLFA